MVLPTLSVVIWVHTLLIDPRSIAARANTLNAKWREKHLVCGQN